jgi:hypothetical protein
MRRPVQFALAAVLLLLCATTVAFYQKYRKATSDFTEMKSAEETARTSYGNAINSIAQIQDSLNAIVLGDSAVRLLPSQFQAEHRLTQSQGDEILDRIAVLRAGIERSKNRIQQLDASLKRSGIKVAGLQKMMANLRRDLAAKESEVAMLTSRVDSLQTQVGGLTAQVRQGEATIQQQTQTIEDKRRELGTIYYAIGTKSALSKSGLIVAKGGFFGIGKTLTPSPTLNDSAFTALDTDVESVVRIPAPKAEIITDQPASSYQLEPVGKELELRILDSHEFRRNRHVVIMTRT